MPSFVMLRLREKLRNVKTHLRLRLGDWGLTLFGGLMVAYFSSILYVFRLASLGDSHISSPSIVSPEGQRARGLVEAPAEAARSAINPCSPNLWTAGSAFFTVMSLCFGYYAQPRGCQLFRKAGRTWRLSPLFAIADIIAIFWISTYILLQLRKRGQDRSSFRTLAVSILAMRIANGQDELDHTTGVKENESPEARQRRKEHPASKHSDSILPSLFAEVNHFEKGPSYRMFVWAPMLLQIVKLIAVRGSPYARLIGFTFFIS